MNRRRYRRGALGLLLITAALTTFVILPLGVLLINVVDSEMTLFRAGEFIDEILPQTYLCLDPVALANGEWPAEQAVVDQFVRNRADVTLPAVLKGKFSIENVQFDYQPGALPVVHCTARVSPIFGSPVVLTRSAELFKKPACQLDWQKASLTGKKPA